MDDSHPRSSATDSAERAAVGVDLALHLLREALAIADSAVVADIECNAVAERMEGGRWYDTRPMLDPREQPDDFIEMARQSIDYAVQRGLVERHHRCGHLVRVV